MLRTLSRLLKLYRVYINRDYRYFHSNHGGPSPVREILRNIKYLRMDWEEGFVF